MNQDTIEHLKNATPEIIKFRGLAKNEQDWLYPLLQKRIRTALDLLSTIENKPRTYHEIAELTELNENTVKQILYALDEGGLRIQIVDRGKAYCPGTGRKRILKRIDRPIPPLTPSKSQEI
jgi:predicted transcriptional regulator